jgi:hypothetical protein
MDGLSINNINNHSGTSNIQQTSDYESFADCMRQSPIIAAAANAQIAKPLTNINFNNHFSIQSSIRVNAEDLSLSNDQQRRRKNGTSSTTVIRKNGKTTTKNETPLLSNLLGTHKFNNDST